MSHWTLCTQAISCLPNSHVPGLHSIKCACTCRGKLGDHQHSKNLKKPYSRGCCAIFLLSTTQKPTHFSLSSNMQHPKSIKNCQRYLYSPAIFKYGHDIYVCIYINIYTYIHIYTYIYIRGWVFQNWKTPTFYNIYIHIYIYIYMKKRGFIYTWKRLDHKGTFGDFLWIGGCCISLEREKCLGFCVVHRRKIAQHSRE